jgi:biopolymer transport protein ExbD
MTSGSGKGPKNEINVTPLVDVVLVLLIIFMVVTPMLQRGKDVDLPKAVSAQETKQGGDPLILSVTSEKKVYLEQDAFEHTALEESLRNKLETAPGRPVLVKGDQRLTVDDVRKVLDIVRRAGAKGVQLAVQVEEGAK